MSELAGHLKTSSFKMQWIDRTKLQAALMAGTFLNLGSSCATEIAADLGFDWLLIDLEHGNGSFADLRSMLLACRGSKSAPIVRIRSIDSDSVKFVLDSGAAGVMFPFVNSVVEARTAVQFVKYPPIGTRGVASVIRASDYGKNAEGYFQETNAQTLVVVQIETHQGVEASEGIAAVEGVDVLFVGPMDLSVNLGCPGDLTRPHFIEAMKKVIHACAKHGKTAGILSRPPLVKQHAELGFRFIALGSDSTSVLNGLQQSLDGIRKASA
jgi:4-hydroxy-2-oxoheptanedioate aldolase